MIRMSLSNDKIQKIDKNMKYKGQRLLGPFDVKNGLSYVERWNFLIIKNYQFFFEREITSFMFLNEFDRGKTNIIFAMCEKHENSYMVVFFWDSKLNEIIEIGRIDFEILDYRDPERILKCFDMLLTNFYEIKNEICSDSKNYILQSPRGFMELIKKCIMNYPEYLSFLNDRLISSLTKEVTIIECARIRERARKRRNKIL